jgi:maltooligosyltrehalose trehalohydrolase
MTAWLLLMPGIPMLFQGQEFAASTPFLYFADHQGKLAQAVRDGRRQFLVQFPSLASSEMQERLADPVSEDDFRRCVLDLGERGRHASAYALHRDLLALRRSDPVLGKRPARVDGAVVAEPAWLLRYFAEPSDRLLLVNLGPDLTLTRLPEPLLAPPTDRAWQVLWSSESPSYDGGGVPALYRDGTLHLPGESAMVLVPGPVTPEAAPELEPELEKEARKRRRDNG